MRYQSSRSVISLPSPIRAVPCSYPFLPLFPYLPSFPFELRLPLLQKCLRALPHVFRRASHSEKRRLQEHPLFLRHFHAALDRLHRDFPAQASVGVNFLSLPFPSSHQLL